MSEGSGGRTQPGSLGGDNRSPDLTAPINIDSVLCVIAKASITSHATTVCTKANIATDKDAECDGIIANIGRLEV